jgi:DegV family protein with EDD domain
MVIAATEWAESGVDADEIVDRLYALVKRSRTYFLVPTLEYLQRGGRIGGASALIGSMLQIKPLLELRNGRAEALERVRTLDLALKRLKQLVSEQCPRTPDARLCVMHADDLEAAQCLAADLKTMLDVPDIPIYGLGSAITVHAGPGTIAAGFFA